ncbi:MAG TPA: hypothetical protein VJZ76_23620 [Thermoanaerobaculia bacterium]|nr:hypothetical protein [Thermoanaerobaculia bacterium]
MGSLKGDDGSSGIVPPGRFGVLGETNVGYGVVGTSSGAARAGVYGQSNGSDDGGLTVPSAGVEGVHDNRGGCGVKGRSRNDTGVVAEGGSFGIRARGQVGLYSENESVRGRQVWLSGFYSAAYFVGDVYINGFNTNSGGGYLIDHPLDPANKYLRHSCVESPDQKNVYDGIATLDRNGEAMVELPAWFGALNRDFCYQLTCLGGHAPVFVAQEIQDNRFRIAGGIADLKVSWQVTGIRQDLWAKANPLIPEEAKPEAERGTFLHPELHGQSEEKSRERVLFPQPS